MWRPDRIVTSARDFSSTVRNIDAALSLASLADFPSVLSLSGYDNPLVLLDDKTNPFGDYYRNALLPTLSDFEPDLIGISYSYSQQFCHGIAIVNEIRKCGLDVPIAVGGAFFTRLCKSVSESGLHTYSSFDLTQETSAVNLLSAIIPAAGVQGEGERPLLEMVKRLERKRDWSDVPGLVIKDEGKRTLIFNKLPPPIPGSQLPAIDLDGLPLGKKYLSPTPIAPAMSSRGCYWNRCGFCDHATLIDSRFRQLAPETVLDTLRSYQNRHGIQFAFFCDEGISPVMLKRLSKEIPGSGIGLSFGSMSRMERVLEKLIKPAADAGLSFLSFGLESGCQRIVSLMNKGFDLDTAASILDKCAENGVLVELHIMFGFPTEEQQEAEETISFLEKHQEKILCMRANPWYLTLGSPVGKDLDLYGIIPVGERPVSIDQSTYRLARGINHEQALGFVDVLHKHPSIGKKIVSSYRTEDYFLIEALKK